MQLLTLDDLGAASLGDHRVLVRVDFNVPMAGGEVLDATRLKEALPTLQELAGAGARILLASHRGRPKGKRDPRLSLRPVALTLADLTGRPVAFADDCIGEEAARVASSLGPGEICLLENLRFHPGEEENDPAFAQELAGLAQAYVNDAFGAAHRAHASVVGVPKLLERKAAGRLLVREVTALGRLLGEPDRPFAALLGGAKMEGKLDTLEHLLPRLDLLALGGGMANTFLAAQGHQLGDSLVEEERLDLARDLLERAHRRGLPVLLPVDLVVTDCLEGPRRVETVPVDGVPLGSRAVDIGEATRETFARALAEAGTIFWNGPMGIFETPPFDAGTLHLARGVAQASAFTVIGGGDTVAAARRAEVLEKIHHVSTGGGAALSFLAGKTLPGIAALAKEDKGP